jgi:hypothetical protein
MQTKWQQIIALAILIFLYAPIHAQLRIGSSTTGVNFREGPGTSFRILHTINSSNLLVVLPREPVDEFIEVFDVETNSRGYVSEKLIQITDTLNFGPQHFFEKSGENTTGHVEIDIINTTIHTLYVWINKFTYDIAPREKKSLVLDDEEVIYFASTPGLFPVFGKEILQKGNTYVWTFTK